MGTQWWWGHIGGGDTVVVGTHWGWGHSGFVAATCSQTKFDYIKEKGSGTW